MDTLFLKERDLIALKLIKKSLTRIYAVGESLVEGDEANGYKAFYEGKWHLVNVAIDEPVKEGDSLIVTE